MAKDDLAARRAELYEAYDEAALRILLDRYGEKCAERVLDGEAELLSRPEARVPESLDLSMARTLSLCARKKKRERREKLLLRQGAKAAVAVLALGAVLSLSGFPGRASQEETVPHWEVTASPEPAEETPVPEEGAEEEEITRESEGTAADETRRNGGE